MWGRSHVPRRTRSWGTKFACMQHWTPKCMQPMGGESSSSLNHACKPSISCILWMSKPISALHEHKRFPLHSFIVVLLKSLETWPINSRCTNTAYTFPFKPLSYETILYSTSKANIIPLPHTSKPNQSSPQTQHIFLLLLLPLSFHFNFNGLLKLKKKAGKRTYGDRTSTIWCKQV